MAIARGPGTEILRSSLFEDCDDTETKLIFGVQHHIYTVLCITAFCDTLNAVTDFFVIRFRGYDAMAGTTAQDNTLLKLNMVVNDAFVWGTKFSFNGHEPTDFAGPLDDAAKQDAIADQGSSVAQFLFVTATAAADVFEVSCSYIDQNNA